MTLIYILIILAIGIVLPFAVFNLIKLDKQVTAIKRKLYSLSQDTHLNTQNNNTIKSIIDLYGFKKPKFKYGDIVIKTQCTKESSLRELLNTEYKVLYSKLKGESIIVTVAIIASVYENYSGRKLNITSKQLEIDEDLLMLKSDALKKLT